MYGKVELILVTRQETIVLPRAKLIVVEHVHVVVRMRYNEPRFNEQNGIIVRRVLRYWNKRIHNVNRVPKLNLPRYTCYHQIGNQINECPFIENNVKQGFVEHFQNLNPELAKINNHGHI